MYSVVKWIFPFLDVEHSADIADYNVLVYGWYL